ncbi:MAG: hypothetical protein JXB62_13665 [Pirellulales bacterium]|nr:hypothetical protein [Pirellulales bacterium]
MPLIIDHAITLAVLDGREIVGRARADGRRLTRAERRRLARAKREITSLRAVRRRLIERADFARAG